MSVIICEHDVAQSECPYCRRAAMTVEKEAVPTDSKPHPDDLAVDAFAKAMKKKLAKKRAEGRGGWETCAPIDLAVMLVEHIAKGDPVDIANFAMFLGSIDAYKGSVRVALRLAFSDYVLTHAVAKLEFP